jgi:protein O-mannosyl-transferase
MQRLRPILISLLLVLATAAVFCEVPQQEFVSWDDNILVYQNRYLNPVTTGNIMYFWQHPHEQLYMPLTYSTWAVIASAARVPVYREMAGGDSSNLDPRLFHTASLAVHLLNVLLLFLILCTLVKNDWAAAAGSLLFGIHPVQVESVAWIAELKGLLSGCFSLLALGLYLRFARADNAETSPSETLLAGASPQWQRIHYVAATVCFVLALLSKPSAVAVPLIAWVLDRWMIQRSLRRSTVAVLPWLAISLLWSVLTRVAQPAEDIIVPLWWRPFVAGDAIAFYLYKLVWPLQLGIDYGRTPQWVMSHTWGYVTWLVPAALAVWLWRNRTQRPWLLAGGLVLVAAVSPVLGLVTFTFQLYSTVADRYLYLGLLGPALIMAWGLAHLQRGRARVAGLCLVALFGLGLRSAFQTLFWYNNSILYRHALTVNPRSWAAHNNLSSVLIFAGENDAAIAHLRVSLHLHPGNPDVYFNLGRALYNQGRATEAIAYFREALRLQPGDVQVLSNLGLALSKTGQTELGIVYLREALRLQPNSSQAHNNLGIVVGKQGKTTEAIEHFREAVRLQPSEANSHFNLGMALFKAGQFRASIAHFREAARIAPSHPKVQVALTQAEQALHQKKTATPANETKPN